MQINAVPKVPALFFVCLVSIDESLAADLRSCVWDNFQAENFSDCLAEASAGKAVAQFTVGKALFAAIGCERNDVDGEQWIERSASQGNLDAIYTMGILAQARFDRDEAASLVKAVEWFTKAAEKGHTDAQYALALTYIRGKSTAKNTELAVKWLTKAAEGNNPEAAMYLYDLFQRGNDVPKNQELASKWLTKAADLGNRDAQTQLGVFYRQGAQGFAQSDEDAIKWLTKAAEQDVVQAQVLLGYLLAFGKQTDKKFGDALKWFVKAVDAGKANEICVIFYKPSDYLSVPAGTHTGKALEWCKKEAEDGNVNAQFALAILHKAGTGRVLKSDAEAYRWGMTAKLRGNRLADEATASWLLSGLDEEDQRKGLELAKAYTSPIASSSVPR